MVLASSSLFIHQQKNLNRPYTREEAAYPLPWLREKKFWPTVSRVDDGRFYVFCMLLYADGGL